MSFIHNPSYHRLSNVVLIEQETVRGPSDHFLFLSRIPAGIKFDHYSMECLFANLDKSLEAVFLTK